MEQSSESHSLQAFDLLRQAAKEYNGAEYKFYTHGFFKYVKEGPKTFLIEDIYIDPDFRGTPVASIILRNFEDFMISEGVRFYYGRVFRASKDYDKRVSTFLKWGMRITNEQAFYTEVSAIAELQYEVEDE